MGSCCVWNDGEEGDSERADGDTRDARYEVGVLVGGFGELTEHRAVREADVLEAGDVMVHGVWRSNSPEGNIR